MTDTPLTMTAAREATIRKRDAESYYDQPENYGGYVVEELLGEVDALRSRLREVEQEKKELLALYEGAVDQLREPRELRGLRRDVKALAKRLESE